MTTSEKSGILIFQGFKETARKIRETIHARGEFIFKKRECTTRPQPRMPSCRLTRLGSAQKVVFFCTLLHDIRK